MPLYPDRERVKALLDEALHLPEAERGEFVRKTTGADHLLRDEVLGLLDALSENPTLFANATRAATHEGATRGTESVGTRIGRYRLLERIGSGGFGDVWRAEQLEPYARTVALKVIKLGMDTDQVVARFEGERQALAMMDHPNIAKVLDGGATESGRPYFVMELVEGVPITTYCDEARLDIRARLDVFTQVCHAVQHAHQKGVIHRDIKPSNVLVGEQDGVPTPRVIDFGIAKATEQRLAQRTAFTERGQLIGTPEYMSPEQADLSSVDVDTRSDIYSLGVLLYELLTGTRPFDLSAIEDQGLVEMMRVIRDEEPPRPSRRLSSGAVAHEVADTRRMNLGALRRALSTDLDWVVLRALEKDRNLRYPTASALAADLQRYLNQEPVEAGPPSATYRLRKFVRRHRTGVVAGALVCVSIGLGLVTTWTMYLESERQARIGQRRFDNLHEFSKVFLYDFQKAIADLPGSRKARLLLAQKGTEYVNRLAAEARDDPEILLDVATGCEQVADIYWAYGLSEPAHVEAARSLSDRALRIFGRLWRERPSMRPRLHALPRALCDRALLELNAGRLAECVRECERAAELLDDARRYSWAARWAHDMRFQAAVLRARSMQRMPGRDAEAARLRDTAAKLLEDHPAWQIDPTKGIRGSGTHRALAGAYNLACTYRDVGQHEAADKVLSKAMTLLGRVEALVDSHLGTCLEAINLLTLRVVRLNELGEKTAARPFAERALTYCQKLVALDPDDVVSQTLLGQAHWLVSRTEGGDRDWPRMRRHHLAESIGVWESLRKRPEDPSVMLKGWLQALLDFAECAAEDGDREQQRSSLDRALEVGRELVLNRPSERDLLAKALNRRAVIDFAAANLSAARARLTEAHQLAIKQLDRNPSDRGALIELGQSIGQLHGLLQRMKRPGDARRLLESHVARLAEWPPDRHAGTVNWQRAGAHGLLVNHNLRRGKPKVVLHHCSEFSKALAAIPNLDLFGVHRELRQASFMVPSNRSATLMELGRRKEALASDLAEMARLQREARTDQADLDTFRYTMGAYQRAIANQRGPRLLENGIKEIGSRPTAERRPVENVILAKLLLERSSYELRKPAVAVRRCVRAVELLESSPKTFEDSWLWRATMDECLARVAYLEHRLQPVDGRKAWGVYAAFRERVGKRVDLHPNELRNHATNFFLCPYPELRDDAKGLECLERLTQITVVDDLGSAREHILNVLTGSVTLLSSVGRRDLVDDVARIAIRFLDGQEKGWYSATLRKRLKRLAQRR